MNIPTDQDIGELFAGIMKDVKAASEAIKADPTDVNSVMDHLNKVNVAANFGKASLFYKASIGG